MDDNIDWFKLIDVADVAASCRTRDSLIYLAGLNSSPAGFLRVRAPAPVYPHVSTGQSPTVNPRVSTGRSHTDS